VHPDDLGRQLEQVLDAPHDPLCGEQQAEQRDRPQVLGVGAAPAQEPPHAQRSEPEDRGEPTVLTDRPLERVNPEPLEPVDLVAGAGTGDEIDRLEWFGIDTLEWAIRQHGRLATVLGLAALGVWWLLRRRGADPEHLRAVTLLCLLLAAQGVVGGVQYLLELPSEIVWVHVALAAFTWLAILWSVAAAGTLQPAAAPGGAKVRRAPSRQAQRV